MNQQQGSPPIKEFRVGGGIKVAIWRNETEQDGRTVVQYSTKPQRRYRDRQTGEWKTTEYFRPQDLPHLILAAQKAFEFTSLKEDEDAQE
ncbi:MAG: hypothetical protein WC869_02245 [Phycisphaerae bacterium]|jgi:hypothetical protein